MAEKSKPMVLSVRFKTEAQGTTAVIQFGTDEREKAIALGYGVVGINFILDVKGDCRLTDAELVTEKT